MASTLYASKVCKTALTGIGWYDFEGSDYSKAVFIARCDATDDVFRYFDRGDAVLLSNHDRAPGFQMERFYIHVDIARDILREFGIQSHPLVFVTESYVETFKEGDVRRDAITALYERDVAHLIAANRRTTPLPSFVHLSKTLHH